MVVICVTAIIKNSPASGNRVSSDVGISVNRGSECSCETESEHNRIIRCILGPPEIDLSGADCSGS